VVGSSLLLFVKLSFIHSPIIIVSTSYEHLANKVKKGCLGELRSFGCLRYSASRYA